MKKLKELTWHEYNTLKNMGFLWELYPEAPFTYSEVFKEKMEELPEVDHQARKLFSETRPDKILMWDKINEIIKKLNGG